MARKPSRGLADVVVASTAVSDADGRAGRLWYRGYDVIELAATATFEEVACLLQRGTPPDRGALDAYRAELAQGRDPGPVTAASIPVVARSLPPVAALRTLVSLAGADDPPALGRRASTGQAGTGPAGEPDREADLRAAARLTAQQPALVAAVHAARAGIELPAPDPGLGLAGSLLHQLTGSRPAPRAAEIFDACLVLHADHLMAASTFAARVCAATLADVRASVVAALAALGGTLHGSASEQVTRELAAAQADGDPVAAAERYTAARLHRGERIAGFGHRAYLAEDPRASALRELSAELADDADDSWHRMARRVEDVVFAERGLYPNADFYTATTCHYLGIPAALLTAVLSVARMAGWTAHVLEQHADNRLIRPGGEYVGETGLAWTPLADR